MNPILEAMAKVKSGHDEAAAALDALFHGDHPPATPQELADAEAIRARLSDLIAAHDAIVSVAGAY